ncbi:heme/hemin ABC transporter substrate-binding protein [Marinobacter halotolerans]|uniref:heme/hemin ABC transporter substrate-binding protein n=1 Tax=Marinobacter halotolerans TaxID=1569211 RepID=UPI001CD9AD79|nr:ABC transporter substrate-binding protein [Marinobacter halotolerans]
MMRWLMAVAGIAAVVMAPLVGAEDTPRLVTADGAITEIVFQLGAGDQVVGVDTTSGYPDATESLPKVGYLRALPFEGVLALKPDMLITSDQAAPAENLNRLSRAGVRVEQLASARTPEAAMRRIERIGELLGAVEQAQTLTGELRANMEQTRKAAANRGFRPRVLFILAAGNHSVMLAGQGTSAEALLNSVGADNAVADIKGYKPANREAILASQPDAIVIAESTPGQFNIENWPGIERLDAWQAGNRLIADSMLLLGFGPRLPQAMSQLSRVLPVDSHVAANDS